MFNLLFFILGVELWGLGWIFLGFNCYYSNLETKMVFFDLFIEWMSDAKQEFESCWKAKVA